MSATVRVTVRGVDGQLLVLGRYSVLRKELTADEKIAIVGRDDQGRQLALTLDVDVLDLIEPAEAPLDGPAHGRRSEDRVLAASRL